MKKITLLLASLFFTIQVWSQTFEAGDIAYNVTGNNAVEATSKTTKYSGNITIPNTVTHSGNSYNVIKIADKAFKDCPGLKSVVISNGITGIGVQSFAYCDSLKSVSIPNSIITIGKQAFRNCDSLAAIVIPGNVKTIEDGTFDACVALKSVTISDGVASIGREAFYGCNSLKTISIPGSVKIIKNSAFENCKNLISVTLSEGVTTLEDDVFGHCTSLLTIDIPNSVTSIGDEAFAETAWFNNQPDGVVYANKVLYEYKQTQRSDTLFAVDIRQGTVEIAYGAFSYTHISSVIIPNSVKMISNHAFTNCNNLVSVYSKSSVPPSCFNISFRSVNPDCILYVPKGSASLYRRTNDWNCIRNIQEIDFDNETVIIISAIPSPFEGGIVTGSEEYDNGATVQVQATAKTGYKFKYWKENNESVYNELSYSFTATANRILTAVFEKDSNITINFTKNMDDAGTVTGGGVYKKGELFQLKAVANSGYKFNCLWDIKNNDFLSTMNGIFNFTASENLDLMAIFKKNEANVTVSVAVTEGGTATGMGEYEAGSSVQLKATANSGYEFLYWAEGNSIQSISSTYSFTAEYDCFLRAVFIPKTADSKITIIATANPIVGGTVTGSGEYEEGATVQLQATAKEGYEFKHWVNGADILSTSAIYSFTATKNSDIVAIFTEKETITITPQSNAATITWPKIPEAKTYSLIIYTNTGRTIVFGEYKLDANGSILTKSSLSCTISGLDAETKYYYTLIAYDEQEQEINVLEGDFTTLKSDNVGIETFANDKASIKVYPNPVTNGKLIIELGQRVQGEGQKANSTYPPLAGAGGGNIQLFDLTGKLIATFAITGEKTEINISHLPNGIYFVKVANETVKVIKK